ncbi:hypothetical protein [Enterocloster asparagiformis]|uniref:hypothetical protein n=1 Tax=Enterocloster asparagiformis TaxID=333367 RepID=UPI0012DDB07F|nr:hypothetical protein [Enterocloster asparagiformis]
MKNGKRALEISGFSKKSGGESHRYRELVGESYRICPICGRGETGGGPKGYKIFRNAY